MVKSCFSTLPCMESYRNKDVSFCYRGRTYNFSLSQELFSSAAIDTGSRFLLKVFSDYLDGDFTGRISLHDEPLSILDSGSGVGVLGICAAGALSAIAKPDASVFKVHVRAQDRDELARIFTEYNARGNGLGEDVLEAFTEPLLSCPPEQKWDLILTNIPAKAGLPVLEDFVRRSASVLKKDGRVFLVAVNTLADFFRSQIKAGAMLIKEAQGKEHTVFVYTESFTTEDTELHGENLGWPQSGPIIFDGNFPLSYPFYIRSRGSCEMEGISYHLDTVHGAPDFDSPGGGIQAAAKLALKLNPTPKPAADSSMLIHDEGQGHFALWLKAYLGVTKPALQQDAHTFRWILSGRNILALSAARVALEAANTEINAAVSVEAIPVVDIFLDRERLAAAARSSGGYSLIACFTDKVTDRTNTGTAGRAVTLWEGLHYLAAPGCIAIIGTTSAEADHFDKKKPPEWRRLGDIKRKGFRALMYRKG